MWGFEFVLSLGGKFGFEGFGRKFRSAASELVPLCEFRRLKACQNGVSTHIKMHEAWYV